MRIEHIAIWTQDLERMKDFYIKFFNVSANTLYHNPKKSFSSYFLSFPNGARIELMHRPEIFEANNEDKDYSGITHLAIAVGSKQLVNELTEKVRAAGYKVIGEPRTTGDGYYESVIADPEGNTIELTI